MFCFGWFCVKLWSSDINFGSTTCIPLLFLHFTLILFHPTKWQQFDWTETLVSYCVSHVLHGVACEHIIWFWPCVIGPCVTVHLCWTCGWFSLADLMCYPFPPLFFVSGHSCFVWCHILCYFLCNCYKMVQGIMSAANSFSASQTMPNAPKSI